MSLNKIRGESSEKSMFPMYKVGMARSVSGEVAASDKKHLRRQQKQSTMCLVVLLVVLVIVIVGITLGLILTLLPSRRDQTPEVRTGPAVIELTTSLMQNFTDDLYDESSQAYRDLEAKFSQAMYELLRNATSPENVVTIEVTGFRNGSVIVFWRLTVTELPDGVPDPDQMVMDRNLERFISDAVRDGIENGILEGLPANTNSIVVISISYVRPNAMPTAQPPIETPTTETCADEPCMGGGTCQDLASVGFICRCPPSREGNRCEQIVTCPALSNPENGVVTCTMANNVNSRCSYTCSDGFLLVGNAVSTCREDRQWMGIMPTCEPPRCELLPEVPGAVMSCSRRNAYQSICTYSCMNGFTLEGGGLFVARLCLANGQWTSSQPTCISTGCPPLVTPSNGALSCTSGRNFGSVCTLSCLEGYRISNFFGQIRQCQTSGRWSGSVASCLPSSCPLLDSIPMGSITCTDGNNFLSTCTYSCAEGFILNNFENENRQCGSNGVWSGVTPTCIRIDTVVTCPPLSAIPFGGVVCSNGNLFESTCEYSCQLGYAIPPDVANVRTCGNTGVWSGPEPMCVDTITCPVLDAIPDGVVTCSDSNRYRSLCNYSCRAGFAISDPNLAFRECQLDGTWTGVPPVCVAISCPTLPDIQDGSFTCDQEFTFGSTCVYSCNDGFTILGIQGNIRSCGVDGMWTLGNPVCVPVTCPDLSPINDGSFTCDQGSSVGSQCVYQCDVGFTFVTEQDAIRTCGLDGQWTGTDPVCTAITCDILPDVPNGNVVCVNENLFRSLCVFTCDFGYDLVGVTARECQSTGLWSGTQPACVPVTPTACPTLPSIENAILDCSSGSDVGSMCTYTCIAGFTPVSGSTEGGIRVCRMDGQWSGGSFFCTAVRCPTLSILRGTVSCTNGNFYLSRCSYTCNPGFSIPADQDTLRICQASGVWTGSTPQCLLSMCSSLPLIPNAQIMCSNGNSVGSSCTYVCDPGYTVGIGQQTIRMCRVDGSWSGQSPTCTAVTCDTLPQIANAVLNCPFQPVFQQTCTYRCNTGFTISPGSSSFTLTCLASGQWDNFIPTCLDVTCPLLSNINFGSVSCTNTNQYLSSCIYQCEVGYNLVPSGSRICQASGVWSGQQPVCSAVSCDPLPQTPNGQVNCPLNPVFQSTCTYTCNLGYNLSSGTATFERTCTASGQWDNFSPICRVVTCPPLFNIDQATLTCTNTNLYESTCTYTCNTGFTLMPDGSRVCQASGLWTGDNQQCIESVCSTLPAVPNGQFQCTQGNVIGTFCTYSCNAGYQLVPTGASRTCLVGGQWSGSDPICQIGMCEDLTGSLSGGTVTCTNGNNFQSQCTLSCIDGFVSSTGADSVLTCAANRVWSGIRIVCFAVQCPTLTAVDFSTISCTSGAVLSSVCTYTCQVGYSLVGNAEQTCVGNGIWTGEPPVCSLVTCPSLPVFTNGAVVCSDGFNFDSVCTYTCNTNFEVASGSSTRSCQADGSWSGSQPVCAQVTCPSLTAIANGAVPDCTSGFAAESICTYQCNTGYEIGSGQSSRTCDGTTQTWSGIEPTCVRG